MMSAKQTTIDDVVRIRQVLRSGRFTRIRSQAGISKAEAARILGVHPTTFSRWEEGDVTPSMESCARLTDLYEVLRRAS